MGFHIWCKDIIVHRWYPVTHLCERVGRGVCVYQHCIYIYLYINVYLVFFYKTGDKPNYLHGAHRRPRKAVPLIIPRGKKSEDSDHLTPPTEAAPVGQPRSTGGLDPDQLFLRHLSLGLLRDKHRSAHTDQPSDSVQGNFMSKSQMFDLTMTLHVVTPSILLQVSCSEQILQFPEMAATASFLWGHWRRSHVTQSETRSFEQE